MRIIGHLDMDAFFASIEERDNPHFRGKPLVVGANPRNGKGRGVVSTANYLARKYGVVSGMPISKAWKLLKEAIFVQPDIEKYEKESERIKEILKKFVKKIEKASIDEFYFDLSFAKSFKRAKEICIKIKEEIKKETNLSCSIGIAQNKLLAKIASQLKKPDGLTLILPSQNEKILDPLPVRVLPGVGPKMEEKLLELKIKTVKDLRKLSRKKLEELFGKIGKEIYQKARGKDNTPIIEKREIKSIGAQTTFLKDTLNPEIILNEFKKLVEKVSDDLCKKQINGFKTVEIIVRFFDFQTKIYEKTFKEPIVSKKDLLIKGINMLLPFLDRRKNPEKKLIRLIGIRVKNFIK